MKKARGKFSLKNPALVLLGILGLALGGFLLVNPLQKPASPQPEAARPTATLLFTATAGPPTPTVNVTPAFTPTLTDPPATPTPTLAPTFTPPLTPSQLTEEPALTVISPTVAVGEPIPVPWAGEVAISVYRTTNPPLMSLQDVQKLLADRTLDWIPGNFYNGKRVTLTAVYGLVTLGSASTDGKYWYGPLNIELPACDTQGTYVPSGTVLPYVEKRPMWVLDYGNTDFPAPGPACMTTPCPTEQIFTNSVYAIDAQTKSTFTGDFYTKR